MRNLYLWLILGCCSIHLIFAQTKLSEKRPPKTKEKGSYQRYEANDMGVFRRTQTFSKPVVKEEIVEIKVEDTLNKYRKVEKHFKNNERYYVEANPNIEKLSLKRPKPQAAQVSTSVIETPVYTPVTTVSRPKKAAPIKARGYRVQLFNGQDRDQANRIKNQFIALFPSIPRYLIFVEPTYRVRVGDFYTKGDADNFLREVKKISAFSDAIVIRDIVEFREDDPTEKEDVLNPSEN